MKNISRTMMMVLLFPVAVTITYSYEMLPESKTSEDHPAVITSGVGIFNVTSDCHLNMITGGCHLDMCKSDLSIALGTSDLATESRHDKHTETEENIYSEHMNSRDPPNRHNSNTATRDVATYPVLVHTPDTIDRMDTVTSNEEGDRDNCCISVIKHSIFKTLLNSDGQNKTLATYPNSSQAIPFVDKCESKDRHGREGRCKECEPQNVTLFLLVEPDTNQSEKYFDKFSIPMYCSCKRLKCRD